MNEVQRISINMTGDARLSLAWRCHLEDSRRHLG